jgi:hypothetical protein
MVDKVASEQVFLRILQCYFITIIPSMLHIHILFVKQRCCTIIANSSASNTESMHYKILHTRKVLQSIYHWLFYEVWLKEHHTCGLYLKALSGSTSSHLSIFFLVS